MPLALKINVALREQNCQKIGSERVKVISQTFPSAKITTFIVVITSSKMIQTE